MRTTRKVSETGFYHVVVKGEADQRLFFDDGDRNKFLSLLREGIEMLRVVWLGIWTAFRRSRGRGAMR